MLKVNQTSSAFGFGAAVRNWEMSSDAADDVKYQDCFYENFNWAVLTTALVWSYMEAEPVRVSV